MFEPFLSIALAFPTVVYSLGLGLVVLYWVFVMVGAVDLDLLDFDVDLDADVDVDVDLDADVDVDGDVDAEAPEGELVTHPTGLWADLASALRIGEVPITVSGSFLVLYGWIATFFAVKFLGVTGVVGALVLAGAALVSVPPSSLSVRPLAPLFRVHSGTRRSELKGQTCIIQTSRVDSGFGQAEHRDGGTSLLLQVRCDVGAEHLTKGSEALIIRYDQARQAYVVEPLRASSE